MFIKFFTVSTLAIVLLTSSNVVLSQEIPPCYMRKSDATITNLSELCQHPPMPQSTSEQPFDPNQGNDGGPPSAPDNVLDPSVKLVPGQTQKPAITVYETPSALWQQLPGLAKPIQENPIQ